MAAFVPSGVIPACLMPFTADLQLNEAAYRSHLRDLAAVDGVAAITINGHAAEVHALSPDEQQRALAIACDEVGDAVPIISGIYGTNCAMAASLAAMAQREGASGLLIFPNEVLALAGSRKQEMALAHVAAVADVTHLPLILFQYPHTSGLGYPMDTLRALCETFPSVAAIKDWCHDPPLHERHIRELHALPRPVRVLTTHSTWLFSSLVLGCDGLLSGAGSVIAALQVALWRAVQSNDLAAARQINDQMYPIVRAFYAEPLVDMHNRMKEALVLLGRLPAAHVRPPLVKLPPEEIQAIAEALSAMEKLQVNAATTWQRGHV